MLLLTVVGDSKQKTSSPHDSADILTHLSDLSLIFIAEERLFYAHFLRKSVTETMNLKQLFQTRVLESNSQMWKIISFLHLIMV